MLKLIGAILLVSGTAAWGFNGVMKLRSRCASLNSIVHALGVMQSEICDRLTPMPELLGQLTQEAEYPARVLFKNAADKMSALGNARFSIIWRQAVAATPELQLMEPEADVLRELGLSLGRYNTEEQKSALQYARRRMEDFARKADTARDTNSRLHAFLGVASGVFAVVVLI